MSLFWRGNNSVGVANKLMAAIPDAGFKVVSMPAMTFVARRTASGNIFVKLSIHEKFEHGRYFRDEYSYSTYFEAKKDLVMLNARLIKILRGMFNELERRRCVEKLFQEIDPVVKRLGLFDDDDFSAALEEAGRQSAYEAMHESDCTFWREWFGKYLVKRGLA